MEYGFNIPNGGALANPDDIAAIAQKGEELGFSLFAIPDHIVFPRSIDSTYPYSESGKFEFSATAGGDFLEPLALMAHVAAVTTRARILTSVMVVPYRHPVLTAKLFSTIDVLSKGRVIVGCGAGWMAEEFPPVGAPPFAERGKVTDEFIAAYRELWTNDDPKFDGDFVEFSNIYFRPKPVQKPHPPIWIGGESGPAMRRAARLGNAWYPIGCNPRHPLNTLERFSAGVDRVRKYAADAGRDPSTLDLAFWSVWPDDVKQTTDDGKRMVLTGSADEVAADIKGFREIGVRHLLFNVLRDTLDDSLAAMERVANDVLPKAK